MLVGPATPSVAAGYEQLTLFKLPDEVIVLVLCLLDARSLARVGATCSALFSERMNQVEGALRQLAATRGHPCPTRLPPGFSSWVTHLAWLEHRRNEARAPVAVGHSHSFFVTKGGQLTSCGAEEEHTKGVLGLGELDGDNRVVRAPTQLPSMTGIRIRSVSTQGGFSSAVSASGAIYTWGDGNWGRLGHGGEEGSRFPKQVHALAGHIILSVATGVCHCLAVTEEGEVFSWGSASSGECGHVISNGDQLLPRRVEALAGVRARGASAGWNHSLVVTENGALYSFGDGSSGQLGHGIGCDEHTPRIVNALQHLRITAAAAGYNHSLALTEDGTVFSWGENSHNQLGLGRSGGWETLPQRVDALCAVKVCSMAAGGDISGFVTSAGELLTMGYGLAGLLGHGDTTEQLEPRRVDALCGECIVSVSVSGWHIIAVSHHGTVFGWGDTIGLGLPGGSGRLMAGLILSTCSRYQHISCQMSA